MSGIFCLRKIATDEEYRKLTKRRLVRQIAILVIGIVTLVINEYTRHAGISNIPEFGQGILSGMGSGLIGAEVIFIIKTIGLLRDEKKLKKARIEESDERNIVMNTESIKIATIVLLFAMYVVFLLGIFITMDITLVIAGLLTLFFVAYIISMIVYSKVM